MNQPGIPTSIQTVDQKNNSLLLIKQKKAVKVLAILELCLTIFCFVGGIVELLLSKQCYDLSCYYLSIGQGIWCSLFPFIASIFGIKASKTAAKPRQIRLLMGFSIVGAVCMATLAPLEWVFLGYTKRMETLQWFIFSAAIANAILMVTSASYSCCMVCPYSNNEMPMQGIVYVAYPQGCIPSHSLPTGMQASPQYVVVNPSQLQVVGGITNPGFLSQPQPNSQSQAPQQVN